MGEVADLNRTTRYNIREKMIISLQNKLTIVFLVFTF